MPHHKITIIGAGSVGVNAALILDKLGFDVTLLESANDILEGAPQATFVTHGDGFEYYKTGHQKTGKDCVDGAITKQLLCPAQVFRTSICDEAHPIRFMISDASVGKDGLTLESFAANAEEMRAHFSKRYNHLSAMRGERAAKQLLMRNPETFAYPLKPEDYAECAHIAGGYAGSSSGINMAHYYAFLKAALKESNVHVTFGQTIDTIKKQDGQYVIKTHDDTLHADHVILAAGHHIPHICQKIEGGNLSAEGNYHLNAMLFVTLPATKNQEKIRQVSHINFTLQQEGGCMFACVLPPNDKEDGLAVVYYPSEKGSQFARHTFDTAHPEPPPAQWDAYIENGLPTSNPHMQAAWAQATYLYPFLKNYAIPDKAICRTVFNAATKDSEHGTDRRVRNIISADHITADQRVTAYRSPKWTNAELVALMAADHALQTLRGQSLPKDEAQGFGHEQLDVETISRDLHFKNVKMHVEDALHYTQKHAIPERLVDLSHPMFVRMSARLDFPPQGNIR